MPPLDEIDKALGDAIDSALSSSSETPPVETPPVETSVETPVETPAVETSAEPATPEPGETQEQADQRVRDKQGRFTRKDDPAAIVKPPAAAAKPAAAAAKPAAAGAPPAAADPAAAAPQPEMVEGRDITKAPSTWKAEAAIDFSQLPKTVRTEIHRREESMFKGIEQYKTAANFGNQIATQFQPYKAMLDSARLAPSDIVNAALQFEYAIRTGSVEKKIELLNNLARSYGVPVVEPREFDENGQPKPPPAPSSPEVVELRKELAELKASNNERVQRERATAQQEENAKREDVRRDIAEFAADPKNEFYSLVREDMLGFIRSGQVSGLKAAYDKAIWANPVTRDKLIARQQEVSRKEAAERAAAANKANKVNVTPRATPPGKTAGKSTLDSALSAAIDQQLASA